MKKLLALIISLTLVLSCLPGAAMAEKYKSKLLNKTIKLPSKLALVDEQQLDDGSVQLIIGVETQPDAAIYTTVQMVEGFDGYTMSTLPDEQLNAWTEYYYQYYPENASAGRLPSNSGAGDTLYMYCGQSADGSGILVYASVKGSLFVSSYCVAAGGFSKATMQGTLEALNAVNVAFGKSASGGSVSDYVFDHNDYDVVVPFLLLEDDDVDLYEDEIFVFTPKGEVLSLRAGSTPLDFAYAVHTEVGNHCVGAKVNGSVVPLTSTLETGDRVRVKTLRGPWTAIDLGIVKYHFELGAGGHPFTWL